VTSVSDHTAPTDAARLAAYLARLSAPLAAAERPARRIVRRLVPGAARLPLRLAGTRALAPWQRRRAAALAAAAPAGTLRLHLGSAAVHLDGWIDVDLAGDGTDLAWDLTRPLPLPDGAAAAVFHEHLLEHLPLPAAAGLLRECHRLLAPGGVLRVGVPDAGAYLRAYADPADGFIDRVRPGRPTPLLAVHEVFQQHGHRSAYDERTLVLLLHAAGFTQAARRTAGDSRIQPCPDSPHRRPETLYVEALR
jgi:SAM-dependent methyltransferase